MRTHNILRFGSREIWLSALGSSCCIIWFLVLNDINAPESADSSTAENSAENSRKISLAVSNQSSNQIKGTMIRSRTQSTQKVQSTTLGTNSSPKMSPSSSVPTTTTTTTHVIGPTSTLDPLLGTIAPVSVNKINQLLSGPVSSVGLVTAYWNSLTYIGNALFLYASVMGCAVKYGLRPVFPHGNPDFPLFQYFNLRAPIINNTVNWSVVNEHCTGCFSPDKFIALAQHDRNYRIEFHLQSFKYFNHINSFLRNDDLKWKDHLRIPAEQRIGNITKEHCPKVNCLLIGVHIRRGDYLLPVNRDYGFTVADRSYFLRGFDLYQSRYGNNSKLVFVIVGNDFKWNYETFRNMPNVTTVLIKPVSAGYDMCLLSMCNHTLMTTGTYGWWVGFLAGGDVVYYKNFPRPGTVLASIMHNDDYNPPHWTGL